MSLTMNIGRSALLPVSRVSLIFTRGKTRRLNHIYPTNNKKEMGLANLTKFPYLHGLSDDKAISIEGVSDKQFPVLLSWERPKHIERWENHPEGSGDGELLPELPNDEPLLGYDEIKEFHEAPEVVKKSLSVEYAKPRQVIEKINDKFVKSVQRHKMDVDSMEVLIARLTVRIRCMQKEVLEREAAGIPKPAKRHVCKILVDSRRVLLRRLREYDVKRFEWLLEKLNLTYKPRPFSWERIDRKKHLERLTDLWCEELKEYHLDELKSSFQSEQPKYLREKAENLRWMKKEEEELGLAVTVNEKDIEECLKKADEIEKELQEAESKKKQFFVYKPEVIDTERVFLK